MARTGGWGLKDHIARHATGQLLAESGISEDVEKSILGVQSDAYAHYYRTVSANYAGKQKRERYELGEKKVGKKLRAV